MKRAVESLEEALDLLRSLEPSGLDSSGWLKTRAQLGGIRDEFEDALNEMSDSLGQGSARDRLLEYLELRVGEVVTKSELREVAGINEWARRIRELRVEHGYAIASGLNREGMLPSEYVLESSDPDEQLAEDWETAKRVRNAKDEAGKEIFGRNKLLAYLQAIHPRPADMERLKHVAKIQSWPRRMRELVEEGWQISSSKTDPSLSGGDYRLDSLIQLSGRPREALKLRHEILDRDNHSCRKCGRNPQEDDVRLEVHHVQWHSKDGKDEPSNLKTLCTSCHAGEHSVDDGTTKDELEHPDVEGSYSSN